MIGITSKEQLEKRRGYIFCKRCMDIAGAIVGGLLFSIPMLIVAIVICLDSQGPAIYQQERLGRGGIPFIVYKFRTMRLNSEENGPQLAETDDERCTRVGKWLRKTHVDELPQLWNVLNGEMSLVGPRPERSYYYEKYEKEVPGFQERLVMKPGLTGLAQINGDYNIPPEEKLKYDSEYIRTCSILLDIRCIIRTLAMLTAEVVKR